MRRRAELAEHPFGTLKCRAGYRHFLVRGFDKVRGEWSLMALCYNFSRVLNILGLDRLIAYFAERAGKLSILHLLNALAVAVRGPTPLMLRRWSRISPKSAPGRLVLGFATQGDISCPVSSLRPGYRPRLS